MPEAVSAWVTIWREAETRLESRRTPSRTKAPVGRPNIENVGGSALATDGPQY